VTSGTTPSLFRILDPEQQNAVFSGRCALTVMAKAPVPGKVKTRLSPPLTSEQAAGLNAAFLRDTMANLGAAAEQAPADCVVSYTPVGQEAAFQGILPASTLLIPQRGDGFGERLLATATDLFRCGYSAVCLIDSDSPTVPTEAFVQAVGSLLGGEVESKEPVVLGWSDDGGYYLIGLTRPHARLFAEIAWSTEAVARQTEERAAELGLPVTRLTTWYDVDDAGSLARLEAEMRGDPGVPAGYAAQHTQRFLQEMNRAMPQESVAGSVDASR
jgi:rSAM/selenodomain-associated transferase 1